MTTDRAPQRSRRRPAWLPGLVLGLCCLLVAAGMYLADQSPFHRTGLESSFAAADGAAWYAEQSSTRSGTADTQTWSVESARYGGLVAVQALAGALADRSLEPYGDAALEQMHIWRLTSTPAHGTRQQTVVFRIDQGIQRIAEDGDEFAAGESPSRPVPGHVFSPALIELPAGARSGDRWQSSGSAGGRLHYRSALAATAGPDGCLQVDGSISFVTTGGDGASRVPEVRQISRSWCPGRGLVAERVSSSSERRSSTMLRPPASAVDTTQLADHVALSDPELHWSDPVGWRAQASDTFSSSPAFGRAPLTDLAAFVPPVVSRSDVLVRATIPGDDLLGVRAPEDDPDTTNWVGSTRMHPGGQIVTVAAFGDVVVVSTTRRRLVAYTASGIRLWRLDLADLVRDQPVRTDAGHAVAVTSAGTVLGIDLRTGHVDWSTPIGADVETPVVADATSVAVTDRSGQLSSLDASTGHLRWRVGARSSDRLLLSDDLVLSAGGEETDGYDRATGRLRWRVVARGSVSGLAAVPATPAGPGRVLIASEGGSSMVDEDGRVLDHLGGYRSLEPVPLAIPTGATVPLLIGSRSDGLDVVDLRGRVRNSLTSSTGLTLLGSRYPVPWSGGVLLLSAPGWPFQDVR